MVQQRLKAHFQKRCTHLIERQKKIEGLSENSLVSLGLLTKLFFFLNTAHFTSQVSFWFSFFFPFASSVRSSPVHPKVTAKISFPIFKSQSWNFHAIWFLWNFHLLKNFLPSGQNFCYLLKLSSYMSSKGASDRFQLLNLWVEATLLIWQ